jgi:uncharacterized protein (TIGR00251 family)
MAQPVPARINVHVQPRASKSEVVGMHGDAIRIRLAAPPVDDAANAELVALIAARLGVPKRNVRIATGRASRRKVVEIEGRTAKDATLALLAGTESNSQEPAGDGGGNEH